MPEQDKPLLLERVDSPIRVNCLQTENCILYGLLWREKKKILKVITVYKTNKIEKYWEEE